MQGFTFFEMHQKMTEAKIRDLNNFVTFKTCSSIHTLQHCIRWNFYLHFIEKVNTKNQYSKHKFLLPLVDFERNKVSYLEDEGVYLANLLDFKTEYLSFKLPKLICS